MSNGDDVYYVYSSGDVVTEAPNGGRDRVYASISYILPANVEELVINSTQSINGTGNEIDNLIAGNAANNVLRGLGGNDMLYGGDGDDDLDGGDGYDILTGGAGNDVYHLNGAWDNVVELANQGRDRVYASFSYALSHNVEELVLTGSLNLKGIGNEQANLIVGNIGNNILFGGGGDDLIYGGDGDDDLDGGDGYDILTGGAGNDVYRLGGAWDNVVELANQGRDRVYSSFSYELPNNVEELVLTGSLNLKGLGNALDNDIYGNDGDNYLYGGAGNDVLYGGAGNDILSGGPSDQRMFDQPGADRQSDRMIGGAGDDIYYVGGSLGFFGPIPDIVEELPNEGHDIVYANFYFNMTSNIEDGVLIASVPDYGLYYELNGNEMDNVLRITAAPGSTAGGGLRGYTGNDQLYGDIGNDVLEGGDGDDVIYGGGGSDTIRDGRGNDIVYGGGGRDVFLMTGENDGDDRFVFTSLDDLDGAAFGESRYGEGWFRSGLGDVIDLSAIDASTLTSEDDAFTYLGFAQFTGQAGELIVRTTDSIYSGLAIMGDVDGDGLQDFTFYMAGTTPPNSGDFIL